MLAEKQDFRGFRPEIRPSRQIRIDRKQQSKSTFRKSLSSAKFSEAKVAIPAVGSSALRYDLHVRRHSSGIITSRTPHCETETPAQRKGLAMHDVS